MRISFCQTNSTSVSHCVAKNDYYLIILNNVLIIFIKIYKYRDHSSVNYILYPVITISVCWRWQTIIRMGIIQSSSICRRFVTYPTVIVYTEYCAARQSKGEMVETWGWQVDKRLICYAKMYFNEKI